MTFFFSLSLSLITFLMSLLKWYMLINTAQKLFFPGSSENSSFCSVVLISCMMHFGYELMIYECSSIVSS